MKTRINWIADDWTRVKNHCRTTVNKKFTDNEPGEKFKMDLLISEHSPIRLLEVDWTWEDIYSWVATHWSRHKFEKFISTQRDDRKEHTISRGDMPQNTLVTFDGYANMQNLIDSFRKRLCFQASTETRQLGEDFKMVLHETHPAMADVLVPNCIYRCGCPEFEMCKQRYFEQYYKRFQFENLGDTIYDLKSIKDRYHIYNLWFYETHEMEE